MKAMMPQSNRPYTHSAQQKAMQEKRTDDIIEAALKMLEDYGLSGLTSRALADAVGASTKVIYGRYDGMPGLWRELYKHGFTLLEGELKAGAATSSTLEERRISLAMAYRKFALSNMNLFDLMYGAAIREHLPDVEDRKMAGPSLAPLVDVFARTKEPLVNARRFWSAIHGVVALELSDWFDAEEAQIHLVFIAGRIS